MEKNQNAPKTTQKLSREDNEQLKYDLTVLVSSKFMFNLREHFFLASASSAERCSKTVSPNALSVYVPKPKPFPP